MKAIFISLFFLGLLSSAALSVAYSVAYAVQQDKPKEFVLCRNHKVVRTIRVNRAENDNEWVTFYTKSGVDHEVGRGRGYDTVKNILVNIKRNLEGAGWRCRDVANSSVIAPKD